MFQKSWIELLIRACVYPPQNIPGQLKVLELVGFRDNAVSNCPVWLQLFCALCLDGMTDGDKSLRMPLVIEFVDRVLVYNLGRRYLFQVPPISRFQIPETLKEYCKERKFKQRWIFFEQRENCVIVDGTTLDAYSTNLQKHRWLKKTFENQAFDNEATFCAFPTLLSQKTTKPDMRTIFTCCSKLLDFHSVSVGGKLDIDSELHVDVTQCITQLNTEIMDLYRCLVEFRTKIRTLSMIENYKVLMPYISHLRKPRAEYRTFSVAASPQMVCQIAMLICPPYVPESKLSSSAWTLRNYSTPATNGRVTCKICMKTMNEPHFLSHFSKVSEFLICCTQSVADTFFSALPK